MDLPPTVAPLPAAKKRGHFEAVVAANVSPCAEHFRLTLRLSYFPPTAPGQFVQLLCRSFDAPHTDEREFDWGAESPSGAPLEAFLRRPFSIAGRHDRADGYVELDIIHRVVGTGTEWLATLSPGDRVSVLGPLGNGFCRPPAPRTALLVGGGVGIPPMLYLAAAWTGVPMLAFAGALRRQLLPLTVTNADIISINATHAALAVDEFADHNVPVVISTDDGSLGRRGLITDALAAYLDANPLLNPVIYTCGPEPMLKAVVALAARRNLDCQVAVERAMACGMGTCQSCCIRIRKSDPAAVPLSGSVWAWRLACTDGPVFEARDILW